MSNADNDFSGSVYVVTGSTQGIGAEVALALARSGAGGIVICGRNREGGEKPRELWKPRARQWNTCAPISKKSTIAGP